MGDEFKDAPLPPPYAPLSPRSNYLKREFPRPPLVQRHERLAPKSHKQIRMNQIRKSLEKPRSIKRRHSANKRSVKRSAQKSFIARNAYTILGHGSEGSSTFILPNNCMVITLAHPGELTYVDKSSKYYRKLATMDMNILLNPLQHKHELTKNFGPLKFYPPGSKCPDFFYQLSSIFPHKNQEKKPEKIVSKYNENENENENENDYYQETLYRAYIPGSGVVNIKSLQKDVDLHESYGEQYSTKEEIESYTSKDIYDEILSHYNNSVLPTKQTIQKKLDSIRLDRSDPSMPYYNYIDALQTIYKSHDYNATQSELIRKLPPGVYYNFVCRDISRLQDIFYKKNVYDIPQPNMKTIPYLKAKHRETGENKYKQAVNVIGQRIGNFSRKELVRNLYTSNSFKRNELHKYNKKIANYTNFRPQVVDLLQRLHKEKENASQFRNIFYEEDPEYLEGEEQLAKYNKNIQRATDTLKKVNNTILQHQKEKTSAARRFGSMKSVKKRRHSAH